jgi:hypothetical protein
VPLRAILQGRIGALIGGVLIGAAVVGAAWYADPLSTQPRALHCSGALTNLVGRPFSSPLNDVLVVIDRAHNEVVRGSQHLPITEVTEEKILYRQVTADVTVAGSIDRFTAAIEESNAKGPLVRSRTNFSCRPVPRLF